MCAAAAIARSWYIQCQGSGRERPAARRCRALPKIPPAPRRRSRSRPSGSDRHHISPDRPASSAGRARYRHNRPRRSSPPPSATPPRRLWPYGRQSRCPPPSAPPARRPPPARTSRPISITIDPSDFPAKGLLRRPSSGRRPYALTSGKGGAAGM